MMITETRPDLLGWADKSPGDSGNCPEAWPTRQGVNVSESTCSIEDCTKPKKVRGWCQMHYTRWSRTGDPNKVLKYHGGPAPKRCSVDGCQRPGPYQRTWCQKHYASWNRYGDPLLSRDTQSRKGGCDVEGCDKKIKRNRQCAMHAWRFETYGSFELPPPSEMHYSSDGYVKVRAPKGSPLGDVNGWTYLHRAVLWEKVGPGEHPCHWCGSLVSWDVPRLQVGALTADHVDWDKENNTPENVVASCRPCNSRRLRRYV